MISISTRYSEEAGLFAAVASVFGSLYILAKIVQAIAQAASQGRFGMVYSVGTFQYYGFFVGAAIGLGFFLGLFILGLPWAGWFDGIEDE